MQPCQQSKVQLLTFNYEQHFKGFSPIVNVASLNADMLPLTILMLIILKIPCPNHLSSISALAPPARFFNLPSSPPAGLQVGFRVGGTSSLVLLICSPPPILLSLYSHSTQFSSSIHQKFPSEVGNVDALCHLPVQAVIVNASHPH